MKQLKVDVNAEFRAIEGCYNRMCVTDDIKELMNMRSYLSLYIDKVYNFRFVELLKGDEINEN